MRWARAARAVPVLFLAACLAACVGPTGEPLPLGPEARIEERPAAELRLVLDQTYIVFMLGQKWTLPYGPYEPEGQDTRGVYFRAPIP